MNTHKESALLACRPLLLCLALLPVSAVADDEPVANRKAEPRIVADSDIDAGRYLITVAGCNDCHTDQWMESNGAVPETERLKGIPIGWRGPWGTTYASNLRLVVQDMPEDAFVAMLKSRQDRPPMPWMNVSQFTESDARAIYRYIRWLGPSGERMPAAVGPDVEPTTAWFTLEPFPPKLISQVADAPPAQ